MPAIRHIRNGSSPLLRAVPDPDDDLPHVDAIGAQPKCMHWRGFLSLSDPKPRPGRLVSIIARFCTNGDGIRGSDSDWRALRDDERVLGWAVILKPGVYGVYGLHGQDGWPIIVGGMNPDPYYRPKAEVRKFPVKGKSGR